MHGKYLLSDGGNLQEVEGDDHRVEPVALKVGPLDVLLDELQQLKNIRYGLCTEVDVMRGELEFLIN